MPIQETGGFGGGRKVRVLVVDDSALVRKLLTEMLASDPGIEVVGSAGDAYLAREKIKQLNPDVLTLDVEMPKMDGVTFLRNLMRLRPMPVVMVSSLTEHGAEITLDALEVGAVDYLPKPKIDLAATLGNYAEELIAKVKMAAQARVRCSLGERSTRRALPEVAQRRQAGAAAQRLPGAVRETQRAHRLRDVFEHRNAMALQRFDCARRRAHPDDRDRAGVITRSADQRLDQAG